VRAGFFSKGEWQELKRIEHPELQALVQKMPGIVLRDRAPSTVKGYTRAVQRWCQWADKYKLNSLPARSTDICIYLTFLLQTARSPSPINLAVSALAWAHEKIGTEDPTSSPLVQQITRGARRILATPRQRRDPVTASQVKAIVDYWLNNPSLSLLDLQIVTLIVFGFASFLRWDELSRLCVNDLEGHWVFIARTGTRYCPVMLVERFLSQGKHSPSQPLFCRIGRRSGHQVLRPQPMSY